MDRRRQKRQKTGEINGRIAPDLLEVKHPIDQIALNYYNHVWMSSKIRVIDTWS